MFTENRNKMFKPTINYEYQKMSYNFDHFTKFVTHDFYCNETR